MERRGFLKGFLGAVGAGAAAKLKPEKQWKVDEDPEPMPSNPIPSPPMTDYKVTWYGDTKFVALRSSITTSLSSDIVYITSDCLA